MPTTKRRRSDDDLSHDIPDAAIAHHKPFTDMHDVLKQLSAPDLAHLPFGGYLAPSDLRNLNACSTLFFHHSEQTHMRTFISSIVEGDIKKIEDLILVYSKIHGVRKVVRWVIDETEIKKGRLNLVHLKEHRQDYYYTIIEFLCLKTKYPITKFFS